MKEEMMLTPFTPGFWKVKTDKYSGEFYVVKGESEGWGEQIICNDIHQGHDNGEADAKLIAAAPDMYEALEELIKSADSWRNTDAINKAKAALSKANPQRAGENVVHGDIFMETLLNRPRQPKEDPRMNPVYNDGWCDGFKHCEETMVLCWKEMCAYRTERAETITKEWLTMNDELSALKAKNKHLIDCLRELLKFNLGDDYSVFTERLLQSKELKAAITKAKSQ